MGAMSTYAKVTVSSTAVTLREIPQGIKGYPETALAIITVEGIAPTATVGHKLEVGDTLILQGLGRITDIKFIRVTTDATLHVSYEAPVW